MPQGAEEQDSPIETLTKKLYMPDEKAVPPLRRAELQPESADVARDFEHEHATPGTFSMTLTKHHTTAKWIFGVAVVFFLASLGAAFFFLSNDRNIISADKIDITVTGPVSIAAGDVLPLAIEITNLNAATLEVADLIIEYPDGTRSAENVSEELTDYRTGLGDIASGARVATSARAILFGEEGSTREIPITLEYRIAGSNAIFVKESVFTVSIGSAPLSITVNGPTKINAGEDVTLDVTIRSNSVSPMQNVVLRAEYPFGFTFVSSDPDTSFSETLWAIGDIEPEGKRTVTIKGTLEGQHNEDRIFRFDLGVAGSRDQTTIGTVFVRAEHEIEIDRPFINLTLTLNGSDTETTASMAGSTIRGELSWRNNLSEKLGDAHITMELDGTAFDESNVSALGGFYSSSNNTITWDKQGVRELAFIDPGDSGTVPFTLTLKPTSSLGGSSKNPEIVITASLVAIPVGEDDTTEAIRSEIQRTIAVISAPTISAKSFYESGGINNTGPVPPLVEEKTTYTVQWTLSNSVNDLSNAVVRATLPTYVTWTEASVPASADITYKPTSREVVWNIGEIEAGTGYSTPSATVAFQVEITPSATQIGSVPVLVNAPTFSALDTFINGEVGHTGNSVTTAISDPGTVGDDARVRAE